jgi:hypothetical protein
VTIALLAGRSSGTNQFSEGKERSILEIATNRSRRLVCAQEVLLNRVRIIESIGRCDSDEAAGGEMFLQVVDGLARRLELCAHDHCAFWTSLYEDDRQRDLERIRRSKLPREQPDFVWSLYREQRLSAQVLRAGFPLSDLRDLAQTGTLNKRPREIVNLLPKLTVQGAGDGAVAPVYLKSE